MSQQKSKADAVGVAQASASSHTRSVSGAHTDTSIPDSTAQVKQLQSRLNQLTHLIRLLADRLAIDLLNNPDDDLAWIQSQLQQLDSGA